MTDKRLVLATAGSEEEGNKIAYALVEARLAACVNIVARVRSVYRWHEEVETAEEWLLIIKTTADAVSRLNDVIRNLHSYEVPECIVLSIEQGSEAYLAWITESVG